MSRESLVFLSGLLLAVLPFLGVPSEWKRYGYISLGIILIALGYSLRRKAFLRSIETAPGEHRAEAFVEHAPLKRSMSDEVAL